MMNTPPDAESNRTEVLNKAVISMAVESWRFAKVFDRVLVRLDARERTRYLGKARWFQKKLEESLADAGLQVVNVEGQAFDLGMAVTPLNIQDFEPGDSLVVVRQFTYADQQAAASVLSC